MQDVYTKAAELGDLIAESEEYGNLRDAEENVNNHPEVKKLVDSFNQLAAEIARKEQTMQPIDPSEKSEMETLQNQVQNNEVLQNLMKAQTDYAMMMNRVNTVLKEKLEPSTEEAKS